MAFGFDAHAQDEDTSDTLETEIADQATTETETEAEADGGPAQLNPVFAEEEKSPRLKPVLRPRLSPVLREDSPALKKDSPEHIRLWGEDRRSPSSTVPPAQPAETPKPRNAFEKPPKPVTAGENGRSGPKSNPQNVRRLAEGKRMLRRGSLASARKIFLSIARQAPASAEAPEALLYAATAQEDLTLVRAELREVVRKYRRSKTTPDALARIGDISLILGDYEEGLSAFRALRRISRGPELRREATSKIILTLVRSGSFEDASLEIETATKEFPGLGRAPEIIDAHGEALLGSGEYRAGAALLADVETQFPNYEFAAKVLLNRGLCEELGGNPAEASEIYREVRSRFPDGIESSLAAARLRDLSIPLNAPPRGNATRKRPTS